MKEAINEPSNSDFAAAITRFVQDYGRDVSNDNERRTPSNVGVREQVVRSSQRCTVPHGERPHRGGGFKGVE